MMHLGNIVILMHRYLNPVLHGQLLLIYKEWIEKNLKFNLHQKNNNNNNKKRWNFFEAALISLCLLQFPLLLQMPVIAYMQLKQTCNHSCRNISSPRK